jgi:hypothetical protein
MMMRILTAALVISVIILSGCIGGVDDSQINSFEECVAAGYPIMESFPRKCMTSDGRTFESEEDRAIADQQMGR